MRHLIGGLTLTAAAVLALAGPTGCGGDDKPGGGGGTGGGGGSGGEAGGGGGSGGGGGGTGGSGGGGGSCPEMVEVSGDVTADVIWESCSVHLLTRHVFVRAPAVLTIEAGTTIKGNAGSSLVITQGAKIMADGTREKPIVFTSSRADGSRRAGDWGGLVVLGRAPINVSTGMQEIEGFPVGTSGTTYGGTVADDDSGIIRYVRIEFAGFELAPNNELNGLTLGGVGSRTVVDHVQSHRGADDGVECFGGRVNLKHVLVSQTDDDGLDWDYGFQGKVQFLIVQQNSAVGDSAYEADNHPTAYDSTPRSMPVIFNASLIGSSSTARAQNGAVLRRGTWARLSNHIVAFFPTESVDLRDAATIAGTMTDPRSLVLASSIVFNNGAGNANWVAESGTGDDDTGFDEGAYFRSASFSNRETDPMLTDPQKQDGPSFLPMSGSPALSGGATPPDDGFFDITATFVGAMGTTDWTAGWTSFPQN